MTATGLRKRRRLRQRGREAFGDALVAADRAHRRVAEVALVAEPADQEIPHQHRRFVRAGAARDVRLVVQLDRGIAPAEALQELVGGLFMARIGRREPGRVHAGGQVPRNHGFEVGAPGQRLATVGRHHVQRVIGPLTARNHLPAERQLRARALASRRIVDQLHADLLRGAHQPPVAREDAVAAHLRVADDVAETLDPAADPVARLDHVDLRALARQQPRGVEPRETGPDHDDVVARRRFRHG